MAEKVSRIYSSFRGVDFRGEEVNLVRSPDALNMWKDYKETESIRTRPDIEKKFGCTYPVYGIYEYKGALLIHTGATLRKRTAEGEIYLHTGMAQNPSQAFVYNDIFYIKDGTNYLRYDGTEVKAVEGYIPTTTIARKPMGGGTKYEDVNMLSDYRINTFLATGADFDYYLDVIEIDDDYVPIVKVDGKEVPTTEFMVDYAEGKITFKTSPPDPPDTDGQDNVWVQFKKAVPQYKKCILESTLLQVFDNRVFFSGNPDLPNWIWHSSLDNPSYVSDLDYYQEGKDTAAVKGMVAGNNALWVFREPSEANTTVFYHTPTIDEEYGKIYPSTHSSVTTGCIGKAINFNDDIVFFSERGMEGISGDVTTEQVVAHRSSLVDRRMTAEADYKNMILAEWEGYLLVFIGKAVYYKVQVGAYSKREGAEAIVTKLKADGYDAIIVEAEGVIEEAKVEAPKPVPPKPEIKVGSNVKLKQGAKTYTGGGLASYVYSRIHQVKQISGDRVVISYCGITVAAVNKKDLTLV